MVGHSGCGKSTMLNIIAGLETASRGGIVLEGREIRGPGIDRMVVFQNFSLMPWMTVWQNVRLAVRSAYPAWSARRWTRASDGMSRWSGSLARSTNGRRRSRAA